MKLKLPKSKRQPIKWGVGAAVLALALTMSLHVGCEQVYGATQKPKTDLDRLEMKYFQHMYPQNDTTSRLRRLEKMVFGEEKTGTEQERLASIIATVPDLGEDEPTPPPKATSKGSEDQSSPTAAAEEPADEGGDIGDYPAVTAMEKHAFGKDFANEPVGGRLARLEKKVFGKPSSSQDLSERVDALKVATRVDVTKKGPPGTEWAEEEDNDGNFPEPSRNTAHDYPGSGIAEPGEDGRSFSGRDLRKDFERAGMRRNAAGGYSSSGSYGGAGSSGVARGGSGSYGMSGGGGSYGAGSGSYGMGAGTDYGSPGSYGSGGGFSGSANRRVAQAPRTAPSYKSQGSSDDADDDAQTGGGSVGGSGGASPGLTRQVDALEKEVFGKTFAKTKTLPDRVSDLEKTIFPQDTKAIPGIPMEDRVARMTAVIPIAAPNVSQQPQQYQQPSQQHQYDPYNDPNMTANNGAPRRGGGGLGKIINSLGSFVSGGMSVGGMGMGGYPMTGYGSPYGAGTYVDPTTGMVIRQNVPYMTNPGYGFGGFNNGFSSPYYSPYSNPMGGLGGGGIRFGTGGFGAGSGFGGTWP